jgi:hypothetical protein
MPGPRSGVVVSQPASKQASSRPKRTGANRKRAKPKGTTADAYVRRSIARLSLPLPLKSFPTFEVKSTLFRGFHPTFDAFSPVFRERAH